ncbi:MAG: TolC family protein [Paenacidovorax caeni]
MPQADDLARWWERFGDAQLSALVAQALQAHPGALSAQAALRQARAQARVQAAGMLPDVSLSGSAQRSRSSGATGNSFQVGLDAGWEPDLFGRLDAGVQASEADARAAQASLEQVHVSLSAEVALQYIALRSLQQRLGIAQRNLETQQQTLQITDWRVQAGLATSLVAEQARAAAEQTAAQVPQLQASLAQARRAGGTHRSGACSARCCTGSTAGGAAAVAGPGAGHPRRHPAPAPGRAGGTGARAGCAGARIAGRCGALPQPAPVRAAWPARAHARCVGRQCFSGALAAGQRGRATVRRRRHAAQVQVQQAALEQARQAYQLAVLTALKEVEDALVALQGEAARLAHLQQAAQAAGNAALLARQRYASGLIDFALGAGNPAHPPATQDALATSQANLGSNHVRLFKALGGGWQ